jgi:hypothetical protein
MRNSAVTVPNRLTGRYRNLPINGPDICSVLVHIGQTCLMGAGGLDGARRGGIHVAEIYQRQI